MAAGDDDEDRRRLKEKLKEALDRDRRSRLREVGSEQVGAWLESTFGICRPDQRVGKRGSRMIHPNSRFAQGMLFASGLLLLYTALVVPVQMLLWDYSNPCKMFPTLYFDLLVDSFFLVIGFEILVQFAIGYHDENEIYVDSYRKNAYRYMTSINGFWFDCATSLPWSYNDIQAYRVCIRKGGSEVVNSNVRVLRVLKVLRILKIIRLLKAAQIVERVEDYAVVYFGAALFKIIRLLSVGTFSVHMFACIFYRVKMASANTPDEVVDFYSSKNVEDDNLMHKYLVCFYYVLTTFTTVGYASLFGTIIAEVNEIVGSLTTKKKDLDNILDIYLAVRPSLDSTTLFGIRKWERFQFYIDYEHQQHQKILERPLPENLKQSIAKKIENNLFSKISFLVGVVGDIRTLFAAQLILRSETRYFAKGSIIADSRGDANGLMVVTSGQVAVELPMDSDDADEENKMENGKTLLYVLERGDSIGDSTISGDLRWGGSLGVNVDFVARTHCSVEFIPLEDMQIVLEKFEFFPLKCRIQRSYEVFALKKDEILAQKTYRIKVVFYWTLVARQISRHLDSHPDLRPAAQQRARVKEHPKISLSATQQNQISEIFNLFDTDGDAVKAIASDGTVTLEEFSQLMMGEVNGRDPIDEINQIFSVLSKPDIDRKNDGYITTSKLQSVCREFRVLLSDEDLKMMVDAVSGSRGDSVDLDSFLTIMEFSPWC